MKFFGRKKKGQSEKCQVCGGTGKVGEERCNGCGGIGYVVLGDITRSIVASNVKSESQNINNTRHIQDIQIMVVEGISDSRQIVVTGWDDKTAFALFKKVRDEVKGK